MCLNELPDERQPYASVADADAATRIWTISEELSGVSFPVAGAFDGSR